MTVGGSLRHSTPSDPSDSDGTVTQCDAVDVRGHSGLWFEGRLPRKVVGGAEDIRSRGTLGVDDSTQGRWEGISVPEERNRGVNNPRTGVFGIFVKPGIKNHSEITLSYGVVSQSGTKSPPFNVSNLHRPKIMDRNLYENPTESWTLPSHRCVGTGP